MNLNTVAARAEDAALAAEISDAVAPAVAVTVAEIVDRGAKINAADRRAAGLTAVRPDSSSVHDSIRVIPKNNSRRCRRFRSAASI